MTKSATENLGGVQSYSAPTVEHVIFSVSSKGDTVINEKIRALYAFAARNGRDLKTLIGSYAAKLEISFLVSADFFADIEKQGFVNDQESFLFLGSHDNHGRRRARLVFQDGRDALDLGYFAALSQLDSLGIKATGNPWTYDIETGLTYATKQDWPTNYCHPGF